MGDGPERQRQPSYRHERVREEAVTFAFLKIWDRAHGHATERGCDEGLAVRFADWVLDNIAADTTIHCDKNHEDMFKYWWRNHMLPSYQEG